LADNTNKYAVDVPNDKKLIKNFTYFQKKVKISDFQAKSWETGWETFLRA
jgi:hypothetical protein